MVFMKGTTALAIFALDLHACAASQTVSGFRATVNLPTTTAPATRPTGTHAPGLCSVLDPRVTGAYTTADDLLNCVQQFAFTASDHSSAAKAIKTSLQFHPSLPYLQNLTGFNTTPLPPRVQFQYKVNSALDSMAGGKAAVGRMIVQDKCLSAFTVVQPWEFQVERRKYPTGQDGPWKDDLKAKAFWRRWLEGPTVEQFRGLHVDKINGAEPWLYSLYPFIIVEQDTIISIASFPANTNNAFAHYYRSSKENDTIKGGFLSHTTDPFTEVTPETVSVPWMVVPTSEDVFDTLIPACLSGVSTASIKSLYEVCDPLKGCSLVKRQPMSLEERQADLDYFTAVDDRFALYMTEKEGLGTLPTQLILDVSGGSWVCDHHVILNVKTLLTTNTCLVLSNLRPVNGTGSILDSAKTVMINGVEQKFTGRFCRKDCNEMVDEFLPKMIKYSGGLGS
ncbi:hypothetical protein HDU67_009749 [Dinochytrium kinnereticum]|nr:hypothetical protein HDU67_009749 [Dinochytrium kinnereticum]